MAGRGVKRTEALRRGYIPTLQYVISFRFLFQNEAESKLKEREAVMMSKLNKLHLT